MTPRTIILSVGFFLIVSLCHGSEMSGTNPLKVQIRSAGTTLDGRLGGFANEQVTLIRVTPHGNAIVRLPLARIESLRVVEPADFEGWLRARTVADIPTLTLRWREFAPLIAVSESPSAILGWRLAELLTESGSLPTAGTIFAALEQQHPEESMREEARLRGLKIALLTAKPDALVLLASDIVEKETSPSLLATAHQLLSKTLEARFKVFLEENPRWQDDPDAVQERDDLYNRILYSYLYAAALYADDDTLASQGMLSAARFHLSLNEPVPAQKILQHIVSLYSTSPAAAEAQKLITSAKPDSKPIPIP